MVVPANILRKNTKGLSQSHPSHRNIYTHVSEHTRIKTTKSYSINWSPFLMSCCLVLLSSDTLDMLSWTSTFRICHSSKGREINGCYNTFQCAFVPEGSTLTSTHCTKMILHQASESTAETPDTAEAPTVTEGAAPGHNQHPPTVPSYTKFLQRTFLPISNLSLVSTHFLQRLQSPVNVSAPSCKSSFSGITAKLSSSSTQSPFKSFTLLLFACWSGN